MISIYWLIVIVPVFLFVLFAVCKYCQSKGFDQGVDWGYRWGMVHKDQPRPGELADRDDEK